MLTFQSRAVGGVTLDSESNSATATVLSAEIEILTAAKSTVEITPMKTAFESVIAILTLVGESSCSILFLAPAYR